jgi:protoporphyrinogen oxidase
MKFHKYIILGAGPAGLSFAHTLKALGENSFLVIEKESVAGGLCRSEEVDGAPLDTGGGHFLDVKREEVLDLIFQFLPESEWQEYERISKIRLRGIEVDYPLEANLWQLPKVDQVDFLESIAQAGCVNGYPQPEGFEKWVTWKLGERIAEEYLLPYNRKIWSTDLSKLGTYWLYKLPDVSFRETLASCLTRQPHGSLPAHQTFLYPKRCGYGEVWKRMGESLRDQIVLSTPISSIDVSNRVINGHWRAGTIINTIPWTEWPAIAKLPRKIRNCIVKLEYVSIDVGYRPDTLPTTAHWIYDPDEKVTHHRILCRSNFVTGSRGYWTETNSKRNGNGKGWQFRNEHAYPMNTLEKPKVISEIRAWAEKCHILALGRWGTWQHMNSDVAVSSGIELAKRCYKGCL